MDAKGRAPAGGSIPFGGFLLVASIAAIFAYGIVLKASGPSVDQTMMRETPAPPQRAAAAVTHGTGGASPSAGARVDRSADSLSDLFGDTSVDPSGASHERPLIPESRSAALAVSNPSPRPSSPIPDTSFRQPAPSPPAPSALLPIGAGSGRASARETNEPLAASASPGRRLGSARVGAAPARTVAQAPVAARPVRAGGTPSPSGIKVRDSSLVGTQSAGAPSTPERAGGRANTDPRAETLPPTGDSTVPSAKVAALDPSVPSRSPRPSTQGPRGDAPAAAVRRAKTSLASRDYRSAARAWNDWAWSAPPGSWTVQIAAVRLDRAKASSSLSSLSSRDGAFVLPAGALGGDLSPVCVGVYPSEDAARRAAAAMGTDPRLSEPSDGEAARKPARRPVVRL